MPEPEQFVRGFIYGDALFDLDARAVLDARANPFSLRSADAQGFIEIAMAGRPSIDQTGAGDRHQQSAQTSSLQPVNRQDPAARSRDQPLAIADVDWPVVAIASRHNSSDSDESQAICHISYEIWHMACGAWPAPCSYL